MISNINQLSLEQKIGQLIWAAGEREEAMRLIAAGKAGGFYVSAPDLKTAVNQFNEWQRLSPIPLLFSADFEWGVGQALGREATQHPTLMALGATGSEELTYQAGLINGREIRAIGSHWNYGPVVDVNTEPKNPIISLRSFGSDPELVARLGAAYVRGMQDGGAIATAKHFPGHGDTDTDSHAALPILRHKRERLERVELHPYRTVIAAGVKSIMTTHILFPEFEPDPRRPATLSRKILTDLLRGELGFDGFVITDSMGMLAIADNFGVGEAAVESVLAGADGILACYIAETYDALLAAARAGRLPLKRIDEAVGRLWKLKYEMGVFEKNQTELAVAQKIVGCQEHRAAALEMARHAVTLVREGSTPILSAAAEGKTAVILVRNFPPSVEYFDRTSGDYDQIWLAELRKRRPQLEWLILDSEPETAEIDRLKNLLHDADEVIVGLDLRIYGQGEFSGRIPPMHLEWMRNLPSVARRPVVACFAAPYTAAALPESLTFLCAYGYDPPSLQATTEIIFGERRACGKLPVELPNAT